MLKKPIVVNLIAAPGSGKSTTAAGVFEQLKLRNVNCELVTEFAKDKVWEENPSPFKDGGQVYLLGKQFYRMHRCRAGVDVIITDSPLCLASYYLRQIENPEVITDYASFDRLVKNLIDSFDNMNYFLDRVKKYNPKGRFQTEEESDRIAKELWEFFVDPSRGCQFDIWMTRLPGNEQGRETIVRDVLGRLAEKRANEPKKPVQEDLPLAREAQTTPPEHPVHYDDKIRKFASAKAVSVGEFIDFLHRHPKVQPCYLPLSMRLSYQIKPETELKSLLSRTQWPVVQGCAFGSILAETFNITLTLGGVNACKTVADLAALVNETLKVQH